MTGLTGLIEMIHRSAGAWHPGCGQTRRPNLGPSPYESLPIDESAADRTLAARGDNQK